MHRPNKEVRYFYNNCIVEHVADYEVCGSTQHIIRVVEDLRFNPKPFSMVGSEFAVKKLVPLCSDKYKIDDKVEAITDVGIVNAEVVGYERRSNRVFVMHKDIPHLCDLAKLRPRPKSAVTLVVPIIALETLNLIECVDKAKLVKIADKLIKLATKLKEDNNGV